VGFAARLVMDPRTGRTKGFGFVKFQTEAEAQNAVKGLNGRVISKPLHFSLVNASSLPLQFCFFRFCDWFRLQCR